VLHRVAGKSGIAGYGFYSAAPGGLGTGRGFGLLLSGVTFTLGVATPDADALRGTPTSLQLFAAVSAATLVP
jgi:hypothetical protein